MVFFLHYRKIPAIQEMWRKNISVAVEYPVSLTERRNAMGRGPIVGKLQRHYCRSAP